MFEILKEIIKGYFAKKNFKKENNLNHMLTKEPKRLIAKIMILYDVLSFLGGGEINSRNLLISLRVYLMPFKRTEKSSRLKNKLLSID